jgi:hypothetical protein
MKRYFLVIICVLMFGTLWADPTPTPTAIYAYSSLDVFVNTYVNITMSAGTYIIPNQWGTTIQPMVQLVPNSNGSMVGFEVCATFDARSITITAYNQDGTAVDCSGTSGCAAAVTIYRDRKNFPWW